MSNLDPNQLAQEYAARHGLKLTAFLGDGTDGNVWKTDRNTAVKAFNHQKNYFMELACYQRLGEYDVTEINGFSVPRLIDFDESVLAIEISVVKPPCVIDFGKAYLDSEPEHSPETWQEHHREQCELWEDRYEKVQGILWKLRQIGIYYRDAKPGNIQFCEMPEA